ALVVFDETDIGHVRRKSALAERADCEVEVAFVHASRRMTPRGRGRRRPEELRHAGATVAWSPRAGVQRRLLQRRCSNRAVVWPLRFAAQARRQHEPRRRITSMSRADLEPLPLTAVEIHRNLSVSSLYTHAIRYDKDSSIAENGALVAYSGAKTGR